MNNNLTQRTVSVYREVLDNFCVGFLFAVATAAWALKRSFLGLLDVTGYLSIKFYQFVLSPDAFRRYWRGLVASWRFSVKSYLYMEERIEYVSMRLQHIVYYRGRIGSVWFNVADDERDGYLVLRTFGDETMTTMNFRCANRWFGRISKPSTFHLNDIMSQALNAGLYVAHIHWKGHLMKPYDVPALKVRDVHGRNYLPTMRQWVQSPQRNPVCLDPHKAQDIIRPA